VTNTPDALDGALLRPGRLEHLLYMPPPSRQARATLLLAQLRRMPLAGGMMSLEGTDRDGAVVGAVESKSSEDGHPRGIAEEREGVPDGLDALGGVAWQLAGRTAGFTGADLNGLCQRAALVALQRSQRRGSLKSRCTSADYAVYRASGAASPPALLAITAEDFDEALGQVAPSVTSSMLRRLEGWRDQRGGATAPHER